MEILEEEKCVIKKINVLLKRGKMPGRGDEKYTIFNTFTVNCLGHAFFNFTNNQIKKLNSQYSEGFRYFLWHIVEPEIQRDAYKFVTEQLEQKIRDTGLILEECDINDKVKDGQWKVAYYYKDGLQNEDFHYMRQEKDGTWSSKLGSYRQIEHFDRLPLMYNDGYCLAKIYKVTNPYVYKETADEENGL